MIVEEKLRMIGGVAHEAVRAYHYSIDEGTVRCWQDVDDDHRAADSQRVKAILTGKSADASEVEDELIAAIVGEMAKVMVSAEDISQLG